MEDTPIIPPVTEHEVAGADDKPKKKRGRKPNPDKRTGYFYEEEEAAFKEYVESNDSVYRSKLFREKLYPALTKMIESISRRYRLFTPDEAFEDTFCDTLSYLMTKVNNFDVSKGYKAYSYCGTICKRYLLLKRTQSMKHLESTVSYDTYFAGLNEDKRYYDPSHDGGLAGELIKRTIVELQTSLADEHDTMTENEIVVGNSVLRLLEQWEDIFIRMGSKKFNKTAVLFFIKEETNLDSKSVRDAMKRFKCLYKLVKKKVIEE